MRNWVKTALFISSFSPALISIALARFMTHGLQWDAIYYGFAGCFGSFVALYVLSAIRWHGEEFAFSAKKIESNDALMLGVIVTYVLPFFGKAADISPQTILLMIGAFAVALWFSNAILPSPTLRLLQYRFYKVESENGVVFTLITQRELLDPRGLKKVKRISSSMLVEVQ